MYNILLFDLDGTLTDPKEGITKSFQYALAYFGIDEKLENLNRVIGPPLVDSFREFYGFDQKTARAAVEKYRERFAETGIYENSVYPGIPEILRDLKDAGMTVTLATSKPIVFAQRILDYYDIARFFDVTVGSELDGTRDRKKDVIEEVFARLGQPERDRALMIGDRRHDIEGAAACGVDALGVRFGYAEPGELEQAGARYIVDTVEEMRKFLLKQA